MSDEQINTAIADTQGFTNFLYEDVPELREILFVGDKDGCTRRVPDYCNDLNAMHEVERTANIDPDIYEVSLARTLAEYEEHEFLWHANAKVRAVAFLEYQQTNRPKDQQTNQSAGGAS